MELDLKVAKAHFKTIIKDQLKRIEYIKSEGDWIDYSSLTPIIIGIIGGDGIGKYISNYAKNVLEFLLQDEVKEGKIKIRDIEGLTIQERVKTMKTVPDDVFEEIKKCHVLLKGPTTTPRKGNEWPNIESTNVFLQRELDLFANVRPIVVPEKKIDWMFFRENTEGAYILGSEGINITNELAIDFKVITTPGSERIIRFAFEYARKNKKKKVTVVTKANIVKATDGKFLSVAEEVAKDYPDVDWDDWYVDIMTAKLIDPSQPTQFKVFVAPNLYGDIITDEAAQLQGGVGTAGSAKIGKKYAMFEAIHGTAPDLIEEGRGKYANPSSIIKAVAMLLEHISYANKAKSLEMALDICGIYEKKIVITGYSDGATGEEFSDYLIETLKDPNLEVNWNKYQKK